MESHDSVHDVFRLLHFLCWSEIFHELVERKAVLRVSLHLHLDRRVAVAGGNAYGNKFGCRDEARQGRRQTFELGELVADIIVDTNRKNPRSVSAEIMRQIRKLRAGEAGAEGMGSDEV